MTYDDAAEKCSKLRDRNSPTGKGRIAVVKNSQDNDELSSLLQHAFGYKLKVSCLVKCFVRVGDRLKLAETNEGFPTSKCQTINITVEEEEH